MPVRRSPRKRRSVQSPKASSEKKKKVEGKAKDPEPDDVEEVDEAHYEVEEHLSPSEESEEESEAEEPSKKRAKAKRTASAPSKGTTRKAASRKTNASRGASLKTMAAGVLNEGESGSLLAVALTATKNELAGAMEEAAKRVMEQEEWNDTLHDLFGFLLRCVGGQSPSRDIDLEDVNKLGEVLTETVSQMEEAPHILWTSEPPTSPSMISFRERYELAWYTLGTVAMENSLAAEDETEDLEPHGPVVDLLTHLADLVNVSITEVRAAATTAVYQIGFALVDQSAELNRKIFTAKRQIQSSARQPQKKKALQEQVESWNEQKEQWEKTLEKYVIGVFLRRYKDVCANIRVGSINALSHLCIARPDIYIQNSFLKYLGWLLNDKDARVRVAAVTALMEPLEDNADNLKAMRAGLDRFFPRLCECVVDVDTKVQEVTLELFNILQQTGHLDSWDDDDKWAELNRRAIAPDTTTKARYSAMLFLVDQLEAFDKEESNEATAVAQLDSIIDWLAHNLAGEGKIPIEHVRYELADLLVNSLRSSPKHESLMSNWAAMMKLLDAGQKSNSSTASSRRMESIKQRIILRVLVSSVKSEATSLTSLLHLTNVDPALIEARKTMAKSMRVQPKARTKQLGRSSHEELTSTLLTALPSLLTTFKTEGSILEDLTSLPQYFLPSVFNLSSRKKDFQKLMKKLSEVFLESTSIGVQDNCSLALICFAEGEHARANDAVICLKKTLSDLNERLQELILEKATGSDAGDSSVLDTQHSISLNFRRLRTLTKRINIANLLVDETSIEAQDGAMEDLFTSMAEYIAKELDSRKMIENADGSIEISQIWESAEADIHAYVSDSVSEAMKCFLCMTAWRLSEAIDSKEMDEETEKNHVVCRMRDNLVKLISLCFEQYMDDSVIEGATEQHIDFSFSVQLEGSKILGDLRSLFPKAWAKSESAFLSSCALVEDEYLTAGLFRFIQDNEDKLRNPDNKESPVVDILLPVARGLTANWSMANRREAGALLSHIAGSGKEATSLIGSMTKVFKKIEPVRYLEAQMAGLVMAFDDWFHSEPPELESQHPTDEELVEFEDAEKLHAKKFELMEQQASRMSSSLGVGQLKNKTVEKAMRGFVREGIRYAFSTNDGNANLACGSRLAFLRILNKYQMWTRKDRETIAMLRDYINAQEVQLRDDVEYESVLEEDKEALKIFRKSGNLGSFRSDVPQETPMSSRSQGSISRESSKRPRSMASSVGSGWSKRSTMTSSLPPVEEENSDDDDDVSPSKRFRLSEDQSSTAGSSRRSPRREVASDSE